MVRGSEHPVLLLRQHHIYLTHACVPCFPILQSFIMELMTRNSHRVEMRKTNLLSKLQKVPIMKSLQTHCGASPGEIKNAMKERIFSKNCQRPKRVGRVRMCNLQSAKNCASVETSLATVHARAQEMRKTDRLTSAPILYFPTRAHRPVGRVFGCVWFPSSDRVSFSGFPAIERCDDIDLQFPIADG